MTDGIRLSLALIEVRHLAELLDEFIDVLDRSRLAHDPGAERLTPDAYPEDEAASAEYRRSTKGELLDRRVADARTVRSALSSVEGDIESEEDALLPQEVVIADAGIDAWLRTLSALRLVIASRLGIDRVDEHDPEDDRFGVYDWIGYRLDMIVQLADERDAATS